MKSESFKLIYILIISKSSFNTRPAHPHYLCEIFLINLPSVIFSVWSNNNDADPVLEGELGIAIYWSHTRRLVTLFVQVFVKNGSLSSEIVLAG